MHPLFIQRVHCIKIGVFSQYEKLVDACIYEPFIFPAFAYSEAF